ncbi:MAG: hypothetical protein V4719_21925 [Planctomycetota bacterium]
MFHSVAAGMMLSAVVTLGYRFAYESTEQAILSISISGAAPKSQEKFYDRFRIDLRHHFHGTENAPAENGISVIESDFFHEKSPAGYAIVEVIFGPRPKFGGLVRLPSDKYWSRDRWAVSLSGGPNVCFDSTYRDYRKITNFLSLNSVRISSLADVEKVRKLVNVLCPNDELAAEGEAQLSQTRWRIGTFSHRAGLQVLELDVSKDGIIESGMIGKISDESI